MVHTLISNYSVDTEVEDDVLNVWMRVENDQVSDHGPFTEVEGLNFSTELQKPEDFFNQLFDKSYAHDKISNVLQGRNQFEQIDHYSNRQHARLGSWKNLNESDIKIFIAHPYHFCNKELDPSQLLVKKFPHQEFFFGTYLSRKKSIIFLQ